MTKFLVTGATGFVGSYICKRLIEDGHKVIGLVLDSRFTYSNLDYYEIKEDMDIARGDLTISETLSPIVTKYRPDILLHFGSQSIVKVAQENPVLTFRVNALGTINLLEVIRQHHSGIKLFIQMSTDKVFGARLAAKENAPYATTCPYSASKIAAELVCKTYRITYGLPILIIRSCNLYGPADFNRRIIPNTIEQMLDKKKVTVFKGDDKRFRQYIHVEDLYGAIMFLLEYLYKPSGPYNVALIKSGEKGCGIAEVNVSPSKGRCYSAEQVVKALASSYQDMTGESVGIETIEREEFPEISEQSLNGSNLLGLGWKPKYSDLLEGLNDTIQWHIDNLHYFKKIRHR